MPNLMMETANPIIKFLFRYFSSVKIQLITLLKLKMRKNLSNIINLILFLFCLKQIIPNLKLDGYSGLFLNILLFTDDTKYSENYNGRKFLKVKKGMMKKQVYELIGKPLSASEMKDGNIRLEYSISPKDTHYCIRQVILKNDIVFERVAYFYGD